MIHEVHDEEFKNTVSTPLGEFSLGNSAPQRGCMTGILTRSAARVVEGTPVEFRELATSGSGTSQEMIKVSGQFRTAD